MSDKELTSAKDEFQKRHKEYRTALDVLEVTADAVQKAANDYVGVLHARIGEMRSLDPFADLAGMGELEKAIGEEPSNATVEDVARNPKYEVPEEIANKTDALAIAIHAWRGEYETFYASEARTEANALLRGTGLGKFADDASAMKMLGKFHERLGIEKTDEKGVYKILN